MTPDSVVTTSDTTHCQARTPSGRRCRMPISNPNSCFCFRHSTLQSKAQAEAAVAARLVGDTGEFRSAVEINRSLGELYKLLARDEIAPRRAAVMAYTANLLLRTLPAIEHELNPPDAPQQIIIDMPGPIRDAPVDPERAFYASMSKYATPKDAPAPGSGQQKKEHE